MALRPLLMGALLAVLSAERVLQSSNVKSVLLTNISLKGRSTNESFDRYITGTSIRAAINFEGAYFSDISSKYMFAVYLEKDMSLTDQTQSFVANMPVDVYLVLNGPFSHVDAIKNQGFTATGEYWRWHSTHSHGGWYRNNSLWPLYRKTFNTGLVSFRLNFGHSAGLFVTPAFQSGLVPTNIVSGGKHGAPVHLRLVSGNTVRWSSIRNWNLTEIDSKYLFSAFFEGDYLMDTSPHSFSVDHPVDVVIAMDGRGDHTNASPLGFHASGEFMRVQDDDYPTWFPVYKKSFGVGDVLFSFREEIKAGIFAVRSTE